MWVVKQIGWAIARQKILELTTVSDEALTLLLLENMWDKWIDHDPKEFFGPGERDETGKWKQARSVCGKYTKNGSGSKNLKAGQRKVWIDSIFIVIRYIKTVQKLPKKVILLRKKFYNIALGMILKA